MRKALLTFGKAQVSALSGGLSDYAIMVTLTEVFFVKYTISIVVSGIIGAAINFSLNRRWAFNSEEDFHHSLKSQLLKFSVVIGGSVLLKSAGTFFVTESSGLDYKISRIAVDLLISYSFNYPLIRYWVFKKAKAEREPSVIGS
ncbi:GtrA family protein [Desertivirga arenae]|uniref:GtrA family protein n=1 Tax=Desertivirga arenae TaxID=2810309 RepID=UPI001F619E7B|nr:GtrA family protein [Pedobacter sp. SYSU D00823]